MKFYFCWSWAFVLFSFRRNAQVCIHLLVFANFSNNLPCVLNLTHHWNLVIITLFLSLSHSLEFLSCFILIFPVPSSIQRFRFAVFCLSFPVTHIHCPFGSELNSCSCCRCNRAPVHADNRYGAIFTICSLYTTCIFDVSSHIQHFDGWDANTWPFFSRPTSVSNFNVPTTAIERLTTFTAGRKLLNGSGWNGRARKSRGKSLKWHYTPELMTCAPYPDSDPKDELTN